MLDDDYQTQFGSLIETLSFDIELPREWASYFDERGEITSYLDDERHNQRLKIRTHGILRSENTFPFCERGDDPIGVYTRDFSAHGAGFLAPFEIFPEERVRIMLPTFWIQLLVVRTRRLTNKCFEVGGSLVARHDPTPLAFARV